MDRCVDGWTYRWMDGCMGVITDDKDDTDDACMDGCIVEWMNGWIDGSVV